MVLVERSFKLACMFPTGLGTEANRLQGRLPQPAQARQYIYPVALTLDVEGRYFAVVRDIPEAITDGESAESALQNMADALGAALTVLGRRLVIEDLVAA